MAAWMQACATDASPLEQPTSLIPLRDEGAFPKALTNSVIDVLAAMTMPTVLEARS
jgi:hypothetical protein